MKRHASKAVRRDARTDIIQKANRFRLSGVRRPMLYPVRPFDTRHIQQAVCVCRRNRLVSAATLELAGYNATERAS